jgi:hypothetical protein
VAFFACPLENVFDQAEKTNARSNRADFLRELALDRLFSGLAELDSAR